MKIKTIGSSDPRDLHRDERDAADQKINGDGKNDPERKIVDPEIKTGKKGEDDFKQTSDYENNDSFVQFGTSGH